MAKPSKVTQSVFDAVKILLSNGATLSECSKYMKLSSDVISFIRDSETLEEYRHLMYQKSAGYRKKIAAAKAQEAKKAAEKVGAVPASNLVQMPQVTDHKITVVATQYMMEEMKKTNELLTTISNKLAYIVDELCGVKTNAQ